MEEGKEEEEVAAKGGSEAWRLEALVQYRIEAEIAGTSGEQIGAAVKRCSEFAVSTDGITSAVLARPIVGAIEVSEVSVARSECVGTGGSAVAEGASSTGQPQVSGDDEGEGRGEERGGQNGSEDGIRDGKDEGEAG